MKFSTPCFVCVEDANKRKELIEWIGRVGYKVYDWYWGECIRVIRCWTTPKGISKAVGYPCKQVRKTDIDCGTNIELFKALAAMNDENDREQWFTDGREWWFSDFNDFDGCMTTAAECEAGNVGSITYCEEYGIRKATADEVIDYFKKTAKI